MELSVDKLQRAESFSPMFDDAASPNCGFKSQFPERSATCCRRKSEDGDVYQMSSP